MMANEAVKNAALPSASMIRTIKANVINKECPYSEKDVMLALNLDLMKRIQFDVIQLPEPCRAIQRQSLNSPW